MVLYAGLVLLCCLGIVAAGEEPLGPNHFQTQPNWNHGHLTTVCIQVRGPHGPELCGPVVPSPDIKNHPEMAATRNSGSSAELQSMAQQQDQLKSAQQVWAEPGASSLRSAVLQGFIGNGPVYQMGPGRAVERLPPLVRVNAFQAPPQGAMVRAQEHPPHQGPCLEHAPRFAGPPPPYMPAPSPEMGPPVMNPLPQLRTFPFAPFGIEQQAGPPPPYQMRQAMGPRMLNPQFMPSYRSAGCQDNVQQPGGGPSMRASSSSYESTMQQQDARSLAKQCEQQEQEIKKKKEEINELKRQLDKLTESARAESVRAESSSTAVGQKTVTTRSSQGQAMDKDVKVEKDLNDSSKLSADYSEKKKKK